MGGRRLKRILEAHRAWRRDVRLDDESQGRQWGRAGRGLQCQHPGHGQGRVLANEAQNSGLISQLAARVPEGVVVFDHHRFRLSAGSPRRQLHAVHAVDGPAAKSRDREYLVGEWQGQGLEWGVG